VSQMVLDTTAIIPNARNGLITSTIPDRHTDAGSRTCSCKSFDKGVNITFIVVRGERDPNASATCSAHNIVTTKSFHNCLCAFARAAQ